eukprot:g2121.t1
MNPKSKSTPLQLCVACSRCGLTHSLVATPGSDAAKVVSIVPLHFDEGEPELHLARTKDGRVFKFGFYCNCVNPETKALKMLPQRILSKKRVLDIACGAQHTVLLVEDRRHPTAMLFGDNTFGQLGFDDVVKQRTPRVLHRLRKHATRVFAGPRHSGVKTVLGGLVMWGGLERRLDTPELTLYDSDSWGGNVLRSAAFGDNHFVVCNGGGGVYVWGSMCSVDPWKDKPTRVAALQTVDIVSVTSGNAAISVLSREGRVYRWGVGVHPNGSTSDFQSEPLLMENIDDDYSAGFSAFVPGVSSSFITSNLSFAANAATTTQKKQNDSTLSVDGVAGVSWRLRLRVPCPPNVDERLSKTWIGVASVGAQTISWLGCSAPTKTGAAEEWGKRIATKKWSIDMQTLLGLPLQITSNKKPINTNVVFPDLQIIWGDHIYSVHRAVLIARWPSFRKHCISLMNTLQNEVDSADNVSAGETEEEAIQHARRITVKLPASVTITNMMKEKEEVEVPSVHACNALLRFIYSGTFRKLASKWNETMEEEEIGGLKCDEIRKAANCWCPNLTDLQELCVDSSVFEGIEIDTCEKAAKSLEILMPKVITVKSVISTQEEKEDGMEKKSEEDESSKVSLIQTDGESSTKDEGSTSADDEIGKFGFGGFGLEGFDDDEESIENGSVDKEDDDSEDGWSEQEEDDSEEEFDYFDNEILSSKSSNDNNTNKTEKKHSTHSTRRRVTARERRIMKRKRARGFSYGTQKRTVESSRDKKRREAEMKIQAHRDEAILQELLCGDARSVHFKIENDKRRTKAITSLGNDIVGDIGIQGTNISGLHHAILAVRVPEMCGLSRNFLSDGDTDVSTRKNSKVNDVVEMKASLAPIAVQTLLMYVYTATVGTELDREAAIDLLVAASGFGLYDLTRLTEIFIMHECLAPENASDVVKLAEIAGASMLQRFTELWIRATSAGGAEVVVHDNKYLAHSHVTRSASSPPLTPRRGAKVFARALAATLERSARKEAKNGFHSKAVKLSMPPHAKAKRTTSPQHRVNAWKKPLT